MLFEFSSRNGELRLITGIVQILNIEDLKFQDPQLETSVTLVSLAQRMTKPDDVEGTSMYP